MTAAAYEVRGVHKTYAGTGARANDGVDLEVPPGEVFGLLGPNGAGKSTLVRQLIGLQRPDRGEIRLFGHDVVADPTAATRLVAYLAQDEPALPERERVPPPAPVARCQRTRADGLELERLLVEVVSGCGNDRTPARRDLRGGVAEGRVEEVARV